MLSGRQLAPNVLREYDIRGIVGETLTSDDVFALGRGFGSLVRRAGGESVAVGYDGRLSSPAFEEQLVAGLAAAGIKVLRIGLGPSPMLYYATHHLETAGGMMITGSHNPPEYNGIKMMLGGRPFFGEDIQHLGRVVAAGDFTAGTGRIDAHDVRTDYIDRLIRDLEDGPALSVAWDAGNGACGAVLGDLARRLDGRHLLIHDHVDGTFPNHHPDPTVEANLEDLKQLVAAERCDLGIAFDGDGDRIGVIDATGRVVWGDQLLVILAAPILAEHPGATIIADVKSSQVFFDEIARRGGRALMSKTGHSLIKDLMMQTGALLAGEMSGHIFFAHRYYGYDDALYAAIRLLSVLRRSHRSIAELVAELPVMVNTPELRIDCAEERKFAVIDEVRARLAGQPGISVETLDGVRVSTADGWWLLRASNTQPVLVGRCEASSEAGLARLARQLGEELSRSGIDPAAVAAHG